MEKTVLIVTAIEGAENLARALSREADAVVEIARSRRAALARLRRDPVTILLIDTSLPETEVTTSEMVWQNAGGAVPLENQSLDLGGGGRGASDAQPDGRPRAGGGARQATCGNVCRAGSSIHHHEPASAKRHDAA